MPRLPGHLPLPTSVRFWLGLWVTCVPIWAAPGNPCPGAEPPNVLYIVCDDLRPAALGCYGSPHVRTPHIDALAARGTRFHHAFCTTSLCSPSRASLLTGQYAHRHGVRNNFTELPGDRQHWPARLQQAGYRTAYVGKWHMGEENDNPRPGFDWFVSHRGQGKYFGTEWNIHGTRRETTAGYYTTVVTDFALEWLRQQPRDQPWALCLGHKAPHSFYLPEDRHRQAFDHVTIPYPRSATQLQDKPDWVRQRLDTWHGIYGPLFDWRKEFPDRSPAHFEPFQNMVRAYWGTILSVDESVGRLLQFLTDSAQLDRTVVVFVGDNGLLEGEHGMVDKRTMHEPSIHIPLLVSGPGVPAGHVVDEQVLTIDLASSLRELCGLEAAPEAQGRSFVRLLNAGDPDWRTAWFYEYDYEEQFPYTPNVRGVRTRRWKFIRYPHGDQHPDRHRAELYDLQADPGEIHNLADLPSHAHLRRELEQTLLDLQTAQGLDPARDPLPLDRGILPRLPDQKIR